MKISRSVGTTDREPQNPRQKLGPAPPQSLVPGGVGLPLTDQLHRTLNNDRGYPRSNRPSQGPLGSDNRIIEKLTRSENTPGTDAAFDLLSEIAVDPDSDERYPDGTVLIPADSPDASVLMSRAIEKRRPFAIVYPDGRGIVAAPRGGPLAFFEHLLTRRGEPKNGQPAVSLPADYRVEIRDRQLAAA
jgi:hypothetical protein